VAATRRGDPHARESGQGLISSVAGVSVFLGFLLVAVHLIVSLYATTTVTSNAYDAARRVASADIDHTDPSEVAAARSRAEADMRRNLGGYSDNVESLDWSGSDAEVVRLRVRARNPSFLVFATRPLGVELIDRTVTVRVETVR
jgi:hypothetical protein